MDSRLVRVVQSEAESSRFANDLSGVVLRVRGEARSMENSFHSGGDLFGRGIGGNPE